MAKKTDRAYALRLPAELRKAQDKVNALQDAVDDLGDVRSFDSIDEVLSIAYQNLRSGGISPIDADVEKLKDRRLQYKQAVRDLLKVTKVWLRESLLDLKNVRKK